MLKLFRADRFSHGQQVCQERNCEARVQRGVAARRFEPAADAVGHAKAVVRSEERVFPGAAELVEGHELLMANFDAIGEIEFVLEQGG